MASRTEHIAHAREMEQRGNIDAAVRAYLAAEAPDHAARVLYGARRFRDAGNLLLDNLELAPGERLTARTLADMRPALRKRALQAGIAYEKAGEIELAVRLYKGLGEIERAVDALKRTGDEVGAARLMSEQRRRTARAPDRPSPTGAQPQQPAAGSGQISVEAARALEQEGKHELAMETYLKLKRLGDAARMARMLQRNDLAADLFGRGGMPYEAALCWAELGDTGKAIDYFARVARDDPRYRSAAIEAITIASTVRYLDFTLENFLGTFLKSEPRDDVEFEAFYRMGELYLTQDFTENARGCFASIEQARPGWRDVRARIASLDSQGRGSDRVFEQILNEDLAFHGDRPNERRRKTHEPPDLPELPDLPDLPGLPDLPNLAAPPTGQTRPPVAEHEPEATRIVPSPMPPGPPARNTGSGVAMQTPVTAHDPTDDHPLADEYDAPMRDGHAQQISDVQVVHAGGVSDVIPSGTRPPAHTGPPAPAPEEWKGIEPGSILDGRYRFLDKLGEGGMAVVYKALDMELDDEPIAIKIFTRSLDDDQMLARFKQELSLSRRLNHPNVIRLYDIGSYQGHRYITMELLDGKDLNHIVGRPIKLKVGIDWLLQMCRGLQAAHDKGVIHRDIKPHNIFVCKDGTVKVMDFGIAKRVSAPGMTVGNFIAGTPEYMSPEQISGFSSVTHSTDLYALGIVSYLMFTGRLPFEHEDMLPLLMMHLNDEPPPPRKHNPSIPVELERVILRLLEKTPSDRFQSCGSLAAALEVVAREIGVPLRHRPWTDATERHDRHDARP